MKKVAVIDSGSGGLNTLKELFYSTTGCQFLFLADEKNAPYGEKEPGELRKIAASLIDLLNSFFKPDIVVVACNTLTSVAIDFLRAKYPEIVFIGCEPAIKPACRFCDEEDVLLLATPVTIRESPLVKEHPNIRALAIENLPILIDRNLFDLDSLVPYLEENLEGLEPQAIVLGCTHFETIKKQLSSITSAKLFGSSEGICRQLKKYCSDEGGNDCSFMSTGGGEHLPAFFHYLMKND